MAIREMSDAAGSNPARVITLRRLTLTERSTIGRMNVFGTEVWTLEDTRREHKVFGETRIPAGRYRLELRNEGGMTARYAARFPDMHRGMVWLQDVPMFDYVYIHIGNGPEHTEGCILVGLGRDTDWIVSSAAAYRRIYPEIVEAIDEGGPVYLDITDEGEEHELSN